MRTTICLSCVVVATMAIAGCGSDTGPTNPTRIGTDTAVDVIAFVNDNHGHIAILSADRIRAEQAVTLDIQGTSVHTHSVALTAAQVGQIGRRQRVEVTSSPPSVGLDTHTHLVAFN